MLALRFRPYDPPRDEAAVYALWQQTLGHLWPLSRAAFHRVTVASGVYRGGDHLVAERGATVAGFVGTQTRAVPGEAAPRGGILCVLVAPERQRQGIGRTLLERAQAGLKKRGAAEAQVGAGGVSYFWPGVPVNLPAAGRFFAACGWPHGEASFDLVRRLDDYATPPEVHERVRQAGVTVAAAQPVDLPPVLAFEGAHFPSWLRYFESAEAEEVVAAKDAGGNVVGTALVAPPCDFLWEAILGANTGGVAVLGVCEDRREQGIGLAIAARVTELLKARGVATSYVGYTWLVDWYGKLGYAVWREYSMRGKRLF